ncbi:hypothetical protein GOBAR_DD32145 [Gossypium barbadense]|nr:hypothetical protein GOBAR_DD32145 [Gossypium barbadense]
MWKLLTATLAQLLVTKDQTLSALVLGPVQGLAGWSRSVGKKFLLSVVFIISLIHSNLISFFSGLCFSTCRVGDTLGRAMMTILMAMETSIRYMAIDVLQV